MKRKVDINCDLGENEDPGSLEIIMRYISSCNIACGFHAGEPSTISKTISSALSNNVAVGAHPSYPDREGFGRNPMHLDVETLKSCLLYQIAALKGMTEAFGGKLYHVKAHGALYHHLNRDPIAAKVLVDVIIDLDKHIQLYGMPGSALEEAAYQQGLKFQKEAFIDRRYEDKLTLRSRRLPDAVIVHEEEILKQVGNFLMGQVICTGGARVPIDFDTLCVHGDTPGALKLVQSVHQLLVDHEVEIVAAK